MFRKTASIFAAATLACGFFAAHAAGFDGMALTTNDWFDASFTALTADTSISQGDTTGITLGAGSWTAVTGYTKASLSGVALTLPDGADESGWVLKVRAIGVSRCLCVAPKTNPFVVIVH